MPTSPIRASRIVLADDHLMFRQALRKMIEERPGLEICGEAGDGLELLELLQRVEPDLVIMDISMPRLRGLEAAPRIKAGHPRVKIMVLTMHGQKEYLYNAVSYGVDGYLLKEDTASELLNAIETVMRGGTYISPLLSRDLREDWVRLRRGEKPPLVDDLSPREKEVMRLIAGGKTCREIADLLSVSVRTVEHHRAHIMDKLNLRRTADLVKYALHKGYV